MTDNVPSPSLVLNAGSGITGLRGLPSCFVREDWRELRLDIDPRVEPDVIGSVIDMKPHFADATFDAVWSSHNLEHLYVHEVPKALIEFRRVLKPDGFALITCPDLQAVATDLLTYGLGHVAYVAPAGPITVQDMIFGHGESIRSGYTFMAHRCGFTQDYLGSVALDAGFAKVRVGRGQHYDLWAVLAMPQCNIKKLKALIRGTHFEFLLADFLDNSPD